MMKALPIALWSLLVRPTHNQLVVIIALALTGVATGSVERGDQNGERRLAPGPFPAIKGARLSVPIRFENEVTFTDCFPILVSDVVIGWIADARVVEGELLVRRCVEYDPAISETAGSRHGGTRLWERARLSDDASSLVPTPVGAPELSTFSNPSFCGKLAAYWALQKGGHLTARIFDVSARKQVAFREIGITTLETDTTPARPVWNEDCSSATFDGDPFVRGTWTLP